MRAEPQHWSLGEINKWNWVTLPRLAGRISHRLELILQDGAYTLLVPKLATILSPAACALGLYYGFEHPGFEYTYLYTGSINFLMISIALSFSAGAAYGFRLWIFYAIGDLLARDWIIDAGRNIIHVGRVAIVLYLLYILIVLIPFITRAFGLIAAASTAAVFQQGAEANSSAFNRAGVLLGYGVYIITATILSGIGVLLWASAAPVLIRPYFTWISIIFIPVDVVAPLQNMTSTLAWLAFGAAAFRATLELLFSRSSVGHEWTSYIGDSHHSKNSPKRVAIVAAKIGRAAWITAMFSGMLYSMQAAAILFLIIATLNVAADKASSVLPSLIPFWLRVPLLVRIVFALAAGFIIMSQSLSYLMTYYLEAKGDFTPLLVSVCVGAVAVLMLVGPLSRREQAT